MELRLPVNKNTTRPTFAESKVFVILGANGAGKTSFGRNLQNKYPSSSQWISGMHALFLDTTPDEEIKIDELSHLQSMIRERIFVPRVTEYEKLMLHLQSEEFEAAVTYKEAAKNNPQLPPPETKIDIIQKIWEKMFPHNKLVRKSGFIELASANKLNDLYKAERMSDGEKIVFYLTGSVLCAPKNGLLIVEEPEIMLHNSIKNPLWDDIEALRPDCTFVYLTHDIDFATSRKNSRRYWIKSFNADDQEWDYEEILNTENFPEEVYLEILGSRKPVLFIEGTDNNSIDNKLYPLIFPEYTVKPMGGCQKVIEVTKAFCQLKELHTLETRGIVDRDRRTDGEIRYLNEKHIYVPKVAEVENLLLLEPVIRTVALRCNKSPEHVFQMAKQNIIELFRRDIDEQVLMHARHKVKKRLETVLNIKMRSMENLADAVTSINQEIHVRELYNGLKEKFTSYIKNGDYNNILRVYNQKGILPESNLCKMCGISNKESYLNIILNTLKGDDKNGETIRNAIKESLGIEKDILKCEKCQ